MDTNDSVLRKVRALLAKAEATPFDAEAEAFTAKAQELIARYRIDRALLDARESRGPETPVARRVAVEDPYLTAKVVLLSTIARSTTVVPFGRSRFVTLSCSVAPTISTPSKRSSPRFSFRPRWHCGAPDRNKTASAVVALPRSVVHSSCRSHIASGIGCERPSTRQSAPRPPRRASRWYRCSLLVAKPQQRWRLRPFRCRARCVQR